MRVAVFLAALLFAAPVLPRGLDDGDVIDLVMVHAQTGKPALILSIDHPVEGDSDEAALDYKIGTYIGFVRSGDLYARYPKAERTERPLFILIFEDQPSPRVRAMTFAAKERLVQMGFDVELKVYDEGARKNVDLAP